MVRSKVTGVNKNDGSSYINILGSYNDGGVYIGKMNVPEAMFWVEGITKFNTNIAYISGIAYYVYQNWNATNTSFNVSVSVSDESHISKHKNPKYMCNVSGTEYTYIAFG